MAPVIATALLAACSGGTAQTSTPAEAETSASPTSSAVGETCSPDAVRSVVNGFLNQASVSPERAVEGYIAPEPAFQWFSGDGRVGPDAHDRGTLAEFLNDRYADGAEHDLEHFQHNGVDRQQTLANFEFRIRKSQGGTSSLYPGKGALDCDTGRIVVWSEGSSPPVP